jgi:endo-1,4-beta-xylanase
MTTRRDILGALAGATLLPFGFAHAQGAPDEPLRDIARRKGMRFGTAIGHGKNQFGDPAYRALVERECNLIVAENEMKWQGIEPAKGKLQFAAPDEMIAWAKSKDMAVRGHNLFWQAEKWVPGWVAKENFGSDLGRDTKRGVEALMRTHVRSVCQHFGDTVVSWDVVNEAVDPADGKLRQNILTRPLGATEQIDLAFHLAHEYAPHAQLVYNDYMRGDAGSAKHRAGVLTLLADLKKRGTPINALGLQSHIGSWDETDKGRSDLLAWRKFLDEVSGMGYDLLITELDVNDRRLPADIAKRDAGVAAATRDYLDVTLSYPRLRDILVWGMSDNISWLQTWDEAPRTDKLAQRPTPYDAQLRAKPMRQAIADAMKAAPARQG